MVHRETEVPEIEIRGHHLLCIQGFQGYGYNKNFIMNMKEVVNKLKSAPELRIKMTDKCDDICAPCPHKVKDECSKEIVKSMDLQVLKDLGIKVGEKVKIKDIVAKIKSNSQKFRMVCKSCEWQKVCLFIV